jgi:hypothetical protein
LLVFAEAVIATGEQQRHLVFELGRHGGGPFKARGGLGGAAGLVISQPQIQQQRRIVGALREGAIVLRDGFFIAAGAGQRGAQVRTRLHRIRMRVQIFPVGPDGAVEVARLMQSDGVLQQRMRDRRRAAAYTVGAMRVRISSRCGADLPVCAGPPGPAVREDEDAGVDAGRRTGVPPHIAASRKRAAD